MNEAVVSHEEKKFGFANFAIKNIFSHIHMHISCIACYGRFYTTIFKSRFIGGHGSLPVINSNSQRHFTPPIYFYNLKNKYVMEYSFVNYVVYYKS